MVLCLLPIYVHNICVKVLTWLKKQQFLYCEITACYSLYYLNYNALFCVHSATTRKVYEKKLQKLLDAPAAEPEALADVTTLPKADSNQNGSTNSDQYSDKEDGELLSHTSSGAFKLCLFYLDKITCSKLLCM